jgi:hypothetical protein
MRLGGEGRVDVGLAESFVLHALEEEAAGRGTSTAREEAPMRPGLSMMAESESPLCREDLGVEWENDPFFGGLGFVTAVVVMGVGANVVDTADGHASDVTTVDHLTVIKRVFGYMLTRESSMAIPSTTVPTS